MHKLKLPSSSSSSPQRQRVTSSMIDIIDLCSSPSSSELKGTPLRPVFCLKNRDAINKIEEREDCFILDFDPHDDDDDAAVFKNVDGAADIAVVKEKGQVACRDYPHSRHVCVNYPFALTPHQAYCHMCYCYVCDVVAPCKDWNGLSGHCHAVDNDAWRLERQANFLNTNNYSTNLSKINSLSDSDPP